MLSLGEGIKRKGKGFGMKSKVCSSKFYKKQKIA
jgi:hypothetical protein